TGRKLLGRFLDHLEIDGDVDLVADHHAAAINVGIPLHAIVLAVDFGRGARGHAGVAPRIFHLIRRTFDIEDNFLCDAANGEVTGDFEFAGRDVFHFFGFESDGGVFGGIKKLFAAEVLVALGFTGVDRFGIDGNVDGGLADVLVVPIYGAVYAFELAAHGGNHEVLDGEASGRVRGIDLPSRGGGQRRKARQSC